MVRKRRRRKKTDESVPAPLEQPQKSTLKDSVIATLNDRLQEGESNAEPPVSPLDAASEGTLDFSTPDRIDTVRLYSTGEDGEPLRPFDYPLNEEVEVPKKAPKAVRIALGVEFGLACALCGAIFLTNVFMPNSAINTFFRAMNTPMEKEISKPYTDFALTPVVSELSDAKLELSASGILSFTDECCVYPAADGKVSELVKGEDGTYTLKISHSDTFTGVIEGLNVVYYAVGDSVKANVPVGFTQGETPVQVTMYSEGLLLNCFQLTDENCLAWVSTAE